MFDFKKLNQLNQMISSEEGRRVLEHQKLRALLTNEEFSKAIKEKNVFKIVSNPEFQKLTQDPEFKQLMVEFKKQTDPDKSAQGWK